MLTTYAAVLKGNRLEWIDEQPESQERLLKVYVTVLEEVSDLEPKYRGDKMVEVLIKLAELAAVSSINDPVVWQQETRSDRAIDY